MVSILRSPRQLLNFVAILQVCTGIALALFSHEVFKSLLIPRPASRLPYQAWGAIGIVLGIGLIFLAKQPLKNRAAILMIMSCKVAAGAICVFVTIQQILSPSFALAGFLLELAPAALIACALVEQAAFPEDVITSNKVTPINSTAAFSLWFVFAGLLALGVCSSSLLQWGRGKGVLPVRHTLAVNANARPAEWKKLPSTFPVAPGTALDYKLVPAFGGMKFTDPVQLVELPDGSGRFLVAERTGKIILVNGGQKSTFLDLRSIVHYSPQSPEEGLLNFALHPGYNDPKSPGFRSIFVFLTRMWESRTCLSVARYRASDEGDSANFGSEQFLFCQAYSLLVHNGGGMAFGPDGFLYIGMGDGFWGAPNLHAQKIDGGFFSGILRVDVDCQGGQISHPIRRPPEDGFSANYFIPSDNPFIAEDGANLEEFYAIGFRNPWRISFDRLSGQLWVADAGFEHREEINRVNKGDNGGWAYLEGSIPTQTINPAHLPRPEKPIGNELAPFYEYPRSISFCTVGGFVYRGEALPSLQGRFVFGDVSGQVAALKFDQAGQNILRTSLGAAPQPLMALCSLAEDAQGELYALTTKEILKEQGVIYKLVAGPAVETADLPRKLSETGLFADLKTFTPDTALTPYQINVPFWSDHAIKTRFVGTQSGLPIQGTPGQPLKFPVGTIFVKHFDFAMDLRNPQQTRRLETRVLVFNADDSWYGVTYRWNQEGTDAELIDDTESETLQVTQLDGSIREQTWQYPDRQACLACHNSVSEGALGFSYRQLSQPKSAANAQAGSLNQLEFLRDCGILAEKTLDCDLDDLRPLAAIDDESRTIEDKARSYLDANCAYCHRNGIWYSTFDVRYETPLEQTQLFSEPLFKNFTEWTQGQPVSHANPAMAIAPGSPEDSFLLRRMNTTIEGRRMPPIGRSVTDERGAALIRDWIASMKSKGNPAALIARPPSNDPTQDPAPR